LQFNLSDHSKDSYLYEHVKLIKGILFRHFENKVPVPLKGQEKEGGKNGN